MDSRIAAYVAQTNAREYWRMVQRHDAHALFEADRRAGMRLCQERAAHHYRIARVALGIEGKATGGAA